MYDVSQQGHSTNLIGLSTACIASLDFNDTPKPLRIGSGWLNLEAGQVTDDTQMSLALGQAIIDHQDWNIKAVSENFVSWLESKPARHRKYL